MRRRRTELIRGVPQFSSWIGWFPILFFSTTWVAEIYAQSQGSPDFASAPEDIRERGTRAGTRAMFFHSVIALTTSIIIPAFVAPTFATAEGPPYLRQPNDSGWIPDRLAAYLPDLPLPWLNLSLLWTFSNGIFSLLLFSSYFAKTSVAGASFIIAGAGFCWAITNWAPFSIVRPFLSLFLFLSPN